MMGNKNPETDQAKDQKSKAAKALKKPYLYQGWAAVV